MDINEIRGILVVIGMLALAIIGVVRPYQKFAKKFDELEMNTSKSCETNSILCECMVYLLRNARTKNSLTDLERMEKKLMEHLAKK